MTKFSSRSGWILAVLGAFVACRDELISDPSFDVWCGNKLCSPWEATGDVSRVRTWHEKDFGIELGDGAVLSQRSASKGMVSCIEFQVIADVDAKAGVDLEMDFRDDGTSEYKQHIPESHWAKLRFLVRAPTWYDGVRFILRKSGKGRAVLAQIQASSSSGCSGEPLTLLDRPLGAACEVPEQCATGVCGEASLDPEGAWAKLKCGECTNEDPCSDGAICGFGLSEVGTYGRCTPTASSPPGTSCVTDAECASGLCDPPKDEPCTPCEGNDCSDDAASQCDARSFAGTCR